MSDHPEDTTLATPGPSATSAVAGTLPSPLREHQALPPFDGQRYLVEDAPDGLLGRGGQGEVRLAHDRVLGREVAVKRLRSELATSATARANLLKEAEVTAVLEHPGVVPMHDAGVAADGSPVLVLRRIEGRSLAQHLKAARGLEERLALVPALIRAAQAVAYAHQRGVVHRDLKPQNLMLGAHGETYVLDWGLAQRDGGDRTESGPEGTPAYMSPEQARGEPADLRSDVWGLGACLYEVLTGTLPLGGRSVLSVLGRAARGLVAPVRAVEPDAPADLAAICEKALQQEPAARYATAGALAADLEAWLAGRAVSARRYTLPHRAVRWVRANRALFTLGVAALLALGAVVGIAQARVRRERDAARTFASSLLFELPERMHGLRTEVDLLNTLTSRAQQWLSTEEVPASERDVACKALQRIAGANFDVHRLTEARTLATQGLELARRSEAAGDLASGLGNQLKALALLGELAGDDTGELDHELERVLALARPLAATTPHPGELLVALAAAETRLGQSAWGTAAGTAHYINSARYSQAAMEAGPEAVTRIALGYGFDGVIALWGEGRLAEAEALGDRLAAAATQLCPAEVRMSESCSEAVHAAVLVKRWTHAADLEALDQRLGRDFERARLLEPDASTVLMRVAVWSLERGDLHQADEAAWRMQALDSTEWALDSGPLAAVLGGDLASFARWEPLMKQPPLSAQLAMALAAGARGQDHDAAAQLRALAGRDVWHEISWPISGLALRFPAARQPALEQFEHDFTVAYGRADHAALAAALRTLADALDVK